MEECLRARPPSQRQRIYNSLRQDIANYSIGPGSQLFTMDIAAKFGVSHIPVREALASLERDGFVEYNPRLGYFARRLNLENIHADVEMISFALRIGAEKICCQKSKDAKFELTEKYMIEDRYSYLSPDVVLEELGGFYKFIISNVANDIFSNTVECSIQRTMNLRSIAFSQNENFLDHVRERHRFVTAMLNGDSQLADDLVRAAYLRRCESLPDLIHLLHKRAT